MWRQLLKRLFTSVTIMFVPHSSSKSIRLRVPALVLLKIAVLSAIGAVYVYSVTVDAIKYKETKEELDYYAGQFNEIKSTISALKVAEAEFGKLFSMNSKEDVLESLNFSDSGAIDMEVLRLQINKTIDNVGEIKDYMSEQRDLYMATPRGWPVNGWLSSSYGRRKHPIKGTRDFHTGVDISSNPGAKIKATADGIVSFAGWSGANGRLVAVEHGFGFRTFYAHNKKNMVKVGDVVQRGDVIAYIGSTGSSTGPHVHYEVWKSGKPANPKTYLKAGDRG
jgi:murein DD-endopeptidase MepM/ murein hydrolase activator NlpD